MKLKHKITLILIVLMGLNQLHSQDSTAESPEITALPKIQSWVIESLSTDIIGNVSEYALLRKLDINVGENFQRFTDFSIWFSEKRQILGNLRPLEMARINYSTELDGTTQKIHIHIFVKESFNIIALPYPKYSDNEGLTLGIRFRDYNFFGNLETLEVNFDYSNDEEGRNIISLASNTRFPFDFLDQRFRFDVEEESIFREGSDLEQSLSGTLNHFFPIGPLTINTKYTQAAFFNEEETSDDANYYLKSVLATGTSLVLPITVTGLGSPGYSFQIYQENRYQLGESLTSSVGGQDTGFYHSMSFGRINWEKNLRTGLDLSIKNDNRFDQVTDSWGRYLETQAIGALEWEWGGFSTRVGMYYHFDDSQDDLGLWIRGIRDNRIEGLGGAFFNFDLPVRVLEFRPQDWFQQSWMRLFSGEIFLSPFFDAFLPFDNPIENRWLGSGMEIFVFSDFFRSFFARLSVGFDIETLIGNIDAGRSLWAESSRDSGPVRELSFGLGHYY